MLLATDSSANKLVDIIQNVSAAVFNGTSSVLYLRDSNYDDDPLFNLVDIALMRLESKIYTVVAPNTTKISYKCANHIIATDRSAPHNFSDHISQEALEVNIRVLVFTRSNRKAHVRQLENTYPLGTEISVVEVTQDERVCIYFAWKRKVSCSDDQLNLAAFERKSWKPSPNRALKLMTFNCPPFVYCDDTKGCYSGIEYNILKEIWKGWPVTVDTVDNDNQISKWTSSFAAVLDGRADMAMCSFWLNIVTNYAPNVSTTYPFLDSCVTFLVPKPQLLPSISYVLQPIQFHLWLLLAAVLIATSATLHEFRKRENDHEALYGESFFSVLRILTGGPLDSHSSSQRWPARFVLLSLNLFALLLSTAYSAGFVSSLAQPRVANPVFYLKDMVSTKLRIDVQTSDVKLFANFLRTFENRYVRKLGDQVVSSALEGYEKIDMKDFARVVKLVGKEFVTDTEGFDEYRKTHLRILKECTFSPLTTFAFRKASRYTIYFNKMLMRLNEHGFTTHWYKQLTIGPDLAYMRNFFSTYVSEVFQREPLTIRQLQGAFLLLVIGLLVAFATFVWEIKKFNHK